MTRAAVIPLEAKLALSVTEVALLLGISRSQAYELTGPDGPIPAVIIGGRRRIARRALDAYLERAAVR